MSPRPARPAASSTVPGSPCPRGVVGPQVLLVLFQAHSPAGPVNQNSVPAPPSAAGFSSSCCFYEVTGPRLLNSEKPPPGAPAPTRPPTCGRPFRQHGTRSPWPPARPPLPEPVTPPSREPVTYYLHVLPSQEPVRAARGARGAPAGGLQGRGAAGARGELLAAHRLLKTSLCCPLPAAATHLPPGGARPGAPPPAAIRPAPSARSRAPRGGGTGSRLALSSISPKPAP